MSTDSTDKTEPTPDLKRKRKTEVRIKARDAGEMMDYDAVVRRSGGEVIEISGSTYCDTKECLRQMLRRVLTERRNPPEDVEKAVRHVVSYLFTSVKSLHANQASAFLNLPVAVEAEIGLELNLYRLDGGEDEDEEECVGWYAEVRTTFLGYDGAASVDGFHEFRKELMLGEYLDDAVAEKLTKELTGLAELACNVSPDKT
jgi:hypothetical protein